MIVDQPVVTRNLSRTHAKRISKKIEAEKERDDIREPWFTVDGIKSCTTWDEKKICKSMGFSVPTQQVSRISEPSTVAMGSRFLLGWWWERI